MGELPPLNEARSELRKVEENLVITLMVPAPSQRQGAGDDVAHGFKIHTHDTVHTHSHADTHVHTHICTQHTCTASHTHIHTLTNVHTHIHTHMCKSTPYIHLTHTHIFHTCIHTLHTHTLTSILTCIFFVSQERERSHPGVNETPPLSGPILSSYV